MTIDGAHDVFRRGSARDVVEAEQLALRLERQRLQQLNLLEDAAVVVGAQVRGVEFLVANDRVEGRGVLGSQRGDLLRRRAIQRHATHRRTAEEGCSNRVDQPVLQIGRRERLRAPTVLDRAARGQGQQDKRNDQTAHIIKTSPIRKGSGCPDEPAVSRQAFRSQFEPVQIQVCGSEVALTMSKRISCAVASSHAIWYWTLVSGTLEGY